MLAYQAHRILDNLFQGGAPPGGNSLAEGGIDVLVLAAKEHQNASMYPGLIVIQAPGDDDERPHRLERFVDIWQVAADQVVEHVRMGRNVLVTCMAGQNRSGFITALAVRKLTGWSGAKIVNHLIHSRPHALNNQTFAKYIIERFQGES